MPTPWHSKGLVWISIGNSPSNGEVMHQIHQPFKSPSGWPKSAELMSSNVFYEVPSTEFTQEMLTISLSPMNSLSLWNSDVLKPRIFMNLIIIWALIATTMYHVISDHIGSYRSFPSTVIIQVFRTPHDLPQALGQPRYSGTLTGSASSSGWPGETTPGWKYCRTWGTQIYDAMLWTCSIICRYIYIYIII